MIADIATIIGAYVVVRLVSLLCRDTERVAVKVMAAIAILGTLFLLWDVWLLGLQTSRNQATIQKQAQSLQGRTVP